jgi:hypothetical protein
MIWFYVEFLKGRHAAQYGYRLLTPYTNVPYRVYFILIHPFGDGNGRVGRALVMAQCLNARLMPPVFDAENRAMYYAAMQHAMKHGRYAPLVRLFYEAASGK